MKSIKLLIIGSFLFLILFPVEDALSQQDTTSTVADTTEFDTLHHHEKEEEEHEHDMKASDVHSHHHGYEEVQDKTLLYQEEKRKETYETMQKNRGKPDKIRNYYKETGMYAFDMVPDHWYDPANRKDLRNQSIFLLISIVALSLVLKFWKI